MHATSSSSPIGIALRSALAAFALAAHAAAQCSNLWAGPSSTNMIVQALATLPNGDIVAGGLFTQAGGVSASRVARWNGTIWSSLGSGVGGVPAPSVRALLALPNGDVVVAGGFTTAGGVAANNIARWDGVAWSPLGSGTDGSVVCLTILPNGDLVAGGGFTSAGGVSANGIARWDGTTWAPLGSGVANPASPAYVMSLTTLPNGDLVAGGNFTTAGGIACRNVARWDGTGWWALGLGVSMPVYALATLANGEVVAGSSTDFLTLRCIHRWSGAGWSGLGAGILPSPYTAYVNALLVLPNGDLAVGGSFTNAAGLSAYNIARWNGAGWSAFPLAGTNDAVQALTRRLNGDLWVGGFFTSAGGIASPYLVRIITTCPATAVAFGVGCSGAGGANLLTATAMPWLGSTFASLATGMPATSVALAVIGLAPTSIPLATLLPQGGAGCTLLVTPDVLELRVPVLGSVAVQVAIPNTSALVGQVFHQQVVPLELDLAGSIVALTSSNALTMTLGTF